MTNWPILALIAALPAPAVFQQQGIHINVETFSSNYTWTVENLSDSAITRFEIPIYNTYNYTVPQGWEMNTDAGRFNAWTTDPKKAVLPGQTAKFALTVTSLGAVLGEVPARIVLADGTELVFRKMWGPVHEPASTIYLIPIVLAVLACVHVLVLTRRAKSRPDPAP